MFRPSIIGKGVSAMETGGKAATGSQEKQPWYLQKKIVVVIIGIAILVVAVVAVAKFVFHVDLLNPSWFAMRRAR